MGLFTSFLSLFKPDYTDVVDIADINSNMDKIDARFKGIDDGTFAVNKATKLATARKINGVNFNGESDITITATDDTKAPKAHASSGTTYGVGTTANYGHCKTINNLTQSSHVNGNALSAYQGKILNDKMLSFYDTVVGSYTGDGTTDFSKVINLGFKPVLVMISSSKQGWDTVIVIREWDNQYSKIVDNGFAVARYGTGNFNNKSGQVYSYVAFR